ncbi:Clavaminate synthase-like protein [Myriangium duriaei CBS 260.36]|uniref:Clavaminate synthase-like protein n=1 Tax=Myriangium duriaei CBS 260.36 TaxID=1168546 RepID=A0A9P4IWN1_9PEZI|nr:Clavaminate synthase-like protein [Myriangium duriaei CBS 260.36]
MADIPIIDISEANRHAARQLLEAATDNGFVFIKPNNTTGISASEIDDMFDLSKAFFACPTAVKSECAINSAASGKNRGWLGMHGETLDPAKQKRGDFKEAFNFSSLDPPQPLSGALAPSRQQLLAFQSKCHALCLRILRLFGVALGTDPLDWFVERHDATSGTTGSVLRMLYYPGLPEDVGKLDEVDIRAGAHSDYGSVTLLFQRRGQPGLEIWSRNQRWESVPVDPTGDTPAGDALPILVNIGDVLSYWTNGLLKSTVHRVIFPKTDGKPADHKELDRYSMVYFCHPLDDAELVSVPSKIVESLGGSEDAKKEMQKVKGLSGAGKVMTAQDHLNARLGATYDLKLKA